MNKEEITCGDIITENSYSKERKVIVIAHSVNGLQLLVVEISALERDMYYPYWTTYEAITEKHDHINLTEAILKQMEKKPIRQSTIPYINICPNCKEPINIGGYCYHCGQKLDWGD